MKNSRLAQTTGKRHYFALDATTKTSRAKLQNLLFIGSIPIGAFNSQDTDVHSITKVIQFEHGRLGER